MPIIVGDVPAAGLHLLSEDAGARVGRSTSCSMGVEGVLAEPAHVPWGGHHSNSHGALGLVVAQSCTLEYH